MYELTDADRIWNRACGDDPLRALPGDRALRDMLRAHGLAMNGGVLHAVECLSACELADAEAGYRYYGFEEVASLMSHAVTIVDAGIDLESHEPQLDRKYAALIPSDSSLVERFEERLKSHPSEFAPLRTKDVG